MSGECWIEPEEGASPADAANELVVQGLLAFLSARAAPARDARVTRVMRAIEGERRRRHFPSARWLLGAAAVLAIGVFIALLGVPGESSAMAQVRRSIDALHALGETRFEVRVLSWQDDRPRPEPSAVVDTRNGLLLVRHWPPWATGDTFVGLDAEGPWAIRSDGGVERADPRRYFPPWSIDDESLLVESFDRTLDRLPKEFDLKRGPQGVIEGRGAFDRVSAVRRGVEGPLPHVVELWIDPATGLPERMEMRWRDDAGLRAHRPPRLMLIDRVDQPALPDDWFEAGAHAGP